MDTTDTTEGTTPSSDATASSGASMGKSATSLPQPKNGQQPTDTSDTKLIPGTKLVYSSDRPLIDYQTCLKELGIQYRDHAFLGIQVSLNGSEWQNYSSGMNAHIYQQVLEQITIKTMTSHKGANFAKNIRDEAVDAMVYKQKYNPLIDWLKKLPTEQCDESVHFLKKFYVYNVTDSVKEQFDEAEIDQYFADALLLIAKGLVSRWIYKDPHFPFFTVLKGEEGIGKSQLIKSILPLAIAEEGAFVDSFDMAQAKKEKDLILRSAAIVECSELQGHSRKDIAEHKSLISSVQTKVRVAYERFPEQILRLAIMIGSTNDDECFAVDPNKQRRHIVLPLALLDPAMTDNQVFHGITGLWHEWRDKLFSHAKYELSQGRGCNYAHWEESSRKIRQYLVKQSERQPVTVDMAIADLLTHRPSISKQYYDEEHQHLNNVQKANGVPLTVPADCPLPSIEKMLVANTARIPGFPKLTPRYLADRMRHWQKLQRRRLPSPYDKLVTPYRPPHDHLIANRIIADDQQSAEDKDTPCPTNESIAVYDTDTPSPTTGQIDEMNRRAKKTKKNPLVNGYKLPPMTTQAEDDAKERRAQRDVDDLYLQQKLSADDNLIQDDVQNEPPGTDDQT